MLNIEDNYSFIAKGDKFEKQTFMFDKIYNYTVTKRQSKEDSPYEKYTVSDLCKPIKLIDTSIYITGR